VVDQGKLAFSCFIQITVPNMIKKKMKTNPPSQFKNPENNVDII